MRRKGIETTTLTEIAIVIENVTEIETIATEKSQKGPGVVTRREKGQELGPMRDAELKPSLPLVRKALIIERHLLTLRRQLPLISLFASSSVTLSKAAKIETPGISGSSRRVITKNYLHK